MGYTSLTVRLFLPTNYWMRNRSTVCVTRTTRWHELGVSLADENDRLKEIILPDPTPEIAEVLDQLPQSMPEGYCLDLTLPAEDLLAQIVALPWEGLLLIFDYGKSLHELL